MISYYDEIQSGFGRTGTLFGYQHYEVEPDLVCREKAFLVPPLSAVLGRGDLIDLDPAYKHPRRAPSGMCSRSCKY